MNDDDHTRGDRDHRSSRPSGRNRHSHGGFGGGLFDALGGASGSGLFDRIMRDVSSWFDDEDERGPRRSSGGPDDVPGGRTPGRQSRDDARQADCSEDFGDVVAGSASARRNAVRADHDDYADEQGDASGSLRGRGPKNYRRTDERITELVNDALHEDHALDASEIEVAVKGGDVTLSGTVPLRRHKHRAENLAAKVSAGHDVDNRLRVRRVASGNDTTSASGSTAPGGRPGESRRDADDYGHPS